MDHYSRGRIALDTLDSFSRTVAQQLFARFPEWRAFARTEPYDDGTSFLLVEVPAASQAGISLTLSTSDDEITLAFDHLHSHFDVFDEQHVPMPPRAAAGVVDDLLNERAVAVSWWNEDRWCGSALRKPAANYGLGHGFEVSTRVRIRSWRGTYDADHAL